MTAGSYLHLRLGVSLLGMLGHETLHCGHREGFYVDRWLVKGAILRLMWLKCREHLSLSLSVSGGDGSCFDPEYADCRHGFALCCGAGRSLSKC